jgi:hypothetical protein
MRIVIQDPTSKAFFDGVSWDNELERAKTFENVAQAEACCAEQQLANALVAVKFNDPNSDFSFPVGSRGALLVSRPQTTKIKSLC